MMAGTLAAYRNPARSSPGARGTGGTGCSSARLRNSSEAMTKPKLTALATKHQPIPAVLHSTAGPPGHVDQRAVEHDRVADQPGADHLGGERLPSRVVDRAEGAKDQGQRDDLPQPDAAGQHQQAEGR